MSMMRRDGAGLSNFDPNLPLNASLTPGFQPRDIDASRLWKTLVRRRRLFFTVAASFFALVVVFTLVQKTRYTTGVRLIAGSANTDGSNNVENANAGGTSISFLNAMLAAKGMQTPETYIDLLLQPTIAREVAANLGLKVPPPTVLAAMKARPVASTAILSLTATWTDAQTSAAIANEWAKVFTAHEQVLIGQQADALLASTRDQMPEAEQKISAAQNELSQYEESVGIADLTTQTTTIIGNEAALEAKQQAAALEAKQATASLAQVQAELEETPPTIVGSSSVAANPVAQSAQTDVARLRGLLAQARLQYTDSMPTVISLKAQLAEAERSEKAAAPQVFAGQSQIPNPVYQGLQTQAATLAAQIASAQSQMATLGQQIAQAKPDVASLPAKARRIAELQRAVKSAQDYFDGLQQKNSEAVIAKSTAISDVTVTQSADPQAATVAPNRLLNSIVGLVAGLILGLVAVFAVEYFDDRFRSGDDIRDRLGLPLLGTIPQLDAESLARNAWIKPFSVEAFHQLVASLRYSSEDPPRTITFTSPDRGDGKSTIVHNTALSMGSATQRVLVIDADLRRPTIHEKFGLSNERGLADVLVGLSTLEDAVKPTEYPGVYVLTSGRPVPNPVALLQSDSFDRMLRESVGKFHQVLIDGPALRPIVDSLMLGIKSDGVVLVVSATKSNGRTVQEALDKLRSVGTINLLGIVLNEATPDEREFSPYYLGAGQSISLPASAE